MKVADMILELAKQPLDAEVLIESRNKELREMTPEDIVYAGEVTTTRSEGPKKSVLITPKESDKVYHIDLTTMQDGKTYHDVVFFAPFTDVDAALDKAKNLMRSNPHKGDYEEPTKEDVSQVWVIDNPLFEEDPGEELAYLYASSEEPEAYPLLEVRYRLK